MSLLTRLSLFFHTLVVTIIAINTRTLKGLTTFGWILKVCTVICLFAYSFTHLLIYLLTVEGDEIPIFNNSLELQALVLDFNEDDSAGRLIHSNIYLFTHELTCNHQ